LNENELIDINRLGELICLLIEITMMNWGIHFKRESLIAGCSAVQGSRLEMQALVPNYISRAHF
jgi:hypothetical protein